MRFLFRVGVAAVAVWIAVAIVPGLTYTGDFPGLLLLGLLIGLVNSVVKPVVTLLSLPLIIVTLGLFILVINFALFALVIWLAEADRLALELSSDGAWSTFLGSLVVSLVSWGLNALAAD